MHQISRQTLSNWIFDALVSSGVTAPDAQTVSDSLVQTSLWGIDSHGVARITHYLERLRTGSICAAPQLQFQKTGAATGNLDGGHGLGFVVCHRAMQEAIALAKDSGAGVVGVRNSSHCGAIGLYTRQASQEDLIGIAFTHSDSFVVPHLGRQAFFGTNPISIAIPSKDPERPLCLDMATSNVPWNLIMNARRENRPVAPGLGVDKEGNDTTDPHAVVALKPMAGHKGYAMAFLIDMLCGPLNGMAFGPGLTKMYSQLDEHRRLGSLMIAIDPARFAGGINLAAVVTEAISGMTELGDQVLYPGQPEYESAEKRKVSGIPVEPNLMKSFQEWSAKLGISCPSEGAQ